MKLLKCTLAAALATVFFNSHAATFTFDGNISTQKDVIFVPFTLDTDTTNVTVWTDSFASGLNFDPITAVWHDGKLVGRNDDDGTLMPGQTYYDSGLHFASLAAGSYLFSITTYNNWNNSDYLSDGFRYSADAPIPLADWCQPASHCGMGSYWRVNLDGVSGAIPPVPEPQAYGMLLLGLALPGWRLIAARRRARGQAS